MIDLETFGTRPGCVIRSIGAVQFDLDGNTGATFYRNISKQSCLDVGLVVDPATERWWAEQAPAAQRALSNDQRPLREVAEEFRAWFTANAEFAWGHGASFDPPLWEAACVAAKALVPWKFWNVRDTRTVYHVFNFETRDLRRRGVHHNALDDAIYQVDCVAAALKKGLPAQDGGVFA
ncbi:3'-5' exonuclease [Rhodopseudomonas pseudopalustris]|nr:3'-5' exonuclease [Rhodopseudomonas pseudopalustris]